MNTVLFDLDGTLLPMDLRGFTDTYFKSIAGRFAGTVRGRHGSLRRVSGRTAGNRKTTAARLTGQAGILEKHSHKSAAAAGQRRPFAADKGDHHTCS